jgi:2-polyprenyl-6-methoxyphenol hydroxylase-like FAD-dependent oxidoreductase
MPVEERLPDFQRDLEGSVAAFFAALPDAPSIAQGARASKLIGIVDYPLYERPVAPRPGLALARDAALTSDPLWGVGCGWAFQSAEWLVEDTALALADGDTRAIAKGLARYQRRHRKELRGHQVLIADFARVRDLNPPERLMFSAASRDARMAEHVDAFASRLIPVRAASSRPARSDERPGSTSATPRGAGDSET